MFNDARSTSITLTSSKGESNLVRKLILKRMADLNKITAQTVDDDSDLDKGQGNVH